MQASRPTSTPPAQGMAGAASAGARTLLLVSALHAYGPGLRGTVKFEHRKASLTFPC